MFYELKLGFQINIQSNSKTIIMEEGFSNETTFLLTQLYYNEFKEEQQLRKLDVQHLEDFRDEYIKPLYPHKPKQADHQLQPYQCKQYCCKLSPGRFCCGKSTISDPIYKNFGLGFCLYIKFLKHITCFLIFVSLLSLVPIILYYYAAKTSNFDVTKTYQNAIFAGTIGIMSEPYSRCQYSKITQNGDDLELQFTIDCPTGTHQFIGIGLSPKSLSTVHSCRVQKDENEFIQKSLITPEPQDNIPSSMMEFSIKKGDRQIKDRYGVYVFSCLNNQYGPDQMKASSIMIVAISFDLVIIFAFILFLISENKAQHQQINSFKLKQLSIHDFTVQINGFTLQNIEEQVEEFVRNYSWDSKSTLHQSEEQLSIEGEDIKNKEFYQNIVSIKIPESEKLREAINKRRQQYKKIYKLIDKNFYRKNIDVSKFSDYSDFIKHSFGEQSDPKFIDFRAKIKSYTINFIKLRKVKYNPKKKTSFPLYIVMNTQHQKKKIIKSAKKGFFSDKIAIGDKTYTVEEPVGADMLIWKNTHKNTCLRVIFVWIVTLAICFGSYLLVGLAIFGRDSLLAQNFSFSHDCRISYTQDQLSNYDQNLSNDENYISCFCEQNFFKDLQQLSLNEKCQEWAKNYSAILGIPILISLGIVIYNLLISRFFRIMTKFEGHKTITGELYSYVIKRAFILIMNMGLIVLLLQLKFESSFFMEDLIFLFSGTFTDITSDWYLKIGVIIVLTLSFNIFLPIFETAFLAFIKFLKRLWDKRCCMRQTSQTTKDGYINLYANNQFPIEERYADIIAILAITLTFSSVIPMAYIITFLSFGFMYLCDKFLLFKVYQKPLNYSQSLQRKVFKTIYFFVAIHCFAALFLLSEPGLLQVAEIPQMYEVSGNNQRLESIVQLPFMIPYITIFCFMVLLAILKHTLILLYHKIKASKDDMKIKSFKHLYRKTNFFNILSNFQINQLKLAMEKQRDLLISHAKGNSHIRVDVSQMVRHKNLIQRVCERTLTKISQIQNSNPQKSKQLSNGINLIGFAGYEEMFDNATYIREKKIQSLDRICSKMIGKQYFVRSKQQKEETESGRVIKIDLDEL